VFFDVAFGLPDIAGVGFENVNREEGDAFSVIVVKLVQGRHLLPKRRSGITAKNQNHGLFSAERGQADSVGLIKLLEIEVGSRITGLEAARSGAYPHGFEWNENIRELGHA
jgi:hypothetical protein